MALFQELRRRKVTRVAAMYAVTAWVLLQVVDVIGEPLGLPEWFAKVVIVLLAIGLPIALILAWAFELTADGVRRSSADDGSEIIPPGRSPIDYAIVALLLIAIGTMVYTSQGRVSQHSEPATSLGDSSTGEAPKPTVLHNSIAVLPFANLSPDPDNAYFAAGMHEETLNQLAKIKDLSIIARTTMLRYVGSDKSIPAIGAELNVGAVMEGSVRYAGERVRITAQLIDVATGAHLWSEAYDRDLKDVFAIQSDIALKITSAMQAEFALEEQRAIAGASTGDFEAYEQYVRGLALVAERPPRVVEALVVFQNAIDIDPNFSDALAAKAMFHGTSLSVMPPPYTQEVEAYNKRITKDLAQRALALDENHAFAHLALAHVAGAEWRWEDQFTDIKAAFDANANHPFTAFYQGLSLMAQGRTEEAQVQYNRAIALDPLNFNLPYFIGINFSAAEHWALASHYYHLSTAAPNAFLSYSHLAIDAVFQGDHDLAETMIAAAASRVPAQMLNSERTTLLEAYALTGMSEAAAKEYEQLERIHEVSPVNDWIWFRANVAMGKVDAALDNFDSVVDRRFPGFGVGQIVFYLDHPAFDPVREEPRFSAALAKIPSWRENVR
ncbi:MAG: tetratricopeptide repeat protein [Pseudomonadales bacterium]